MPHTERIQLNFPIEHDDLTIAEIALRRPTVGDQGKGPGSINLLY